MFFNTKKPNDLDCHLNHSVSMAAGLGFEPRQTESESVVLPLHNPATNSYIIMGKLRNVKNFFKKFSILFFPDFRQIFKEDYILICLIMQHELFGIFNMRLLTEHPPFSKIQSKPSGIVKR